MEKGERKICTEEALQLAEVFGITVSALVDPSKDIKVVLEEAKQESPQTSQLRINVPQRSWTKFIEVLLYILHRVGTKLNIGQTVLYKLLYFIDFDFYELYEEQLIGAVYIKNKHGPTPVAFREILSRMAEDEDIVELETEYHGYKQTRYLPRRKPDLSIFRGHEIDLVNEVLDKLSNMNAAQISEYSHGDVPWLATEEGEIIEYEAVFYRTPLYSVREYDDIQEDNVST
jgi:uncharacterized phage-associated protein